MLWVEASLANVFSMSFCVMIHLCENDLETWDQGYFLRTKSPLSPDYIFSSIQDPSLNQAKKDSLRLTTLFQERPIYLHVACTLA